MDFKAQVESLTGLTISGSGTTPTETELSQFLTDGVKDVVNKFLLIMPNEAYKFSQTQECTSTGLPVIGRILGVVRENGSADNLRECTEISPTHRTMSKDSTSLHYRSKVNPGYYTLNSNVFIIPDPNDNGERAYVTHIWYPTVLHGDSAIGTSTTTKQSDDIECTRPTSGDPSQFNKTSHPFVEGDKVLLSNFTQATDLNGISATVKYVDANSFQLYGVLAQPAAETSVGDDLGGTMTTAYNASLGFPDEYEYLVVLYGAIKSVEAKLASYTIDDEDLELVRGYANTLATLKNQYFSSFGVRSEANIGSTDEELNR